MSPEAYYLAAIVGLMLASFVIKGWRRIIPVLFIGLLIPQHSSAQGYDNDNDVPTLIQIRDQIIAQQTMLDNYFSGYTAPNKLNDISNALSSNGVSVTDAVEDGLRRWDGTEYGQLISDNTSDISNALDVTTFGTLGYLLNNNLNHIKNNTTFSKNSDQNISNNTADISNYTEDSLTELQDISNNMQTVRDRTYYNDWYLNMIQQRIGNTNNGSSNELLSDISNTLTNASLLDNTIRNGVTMNNTSAILSALQAGGSWDQDNDVPAIQALESLLAGYGQWDTDNDVDAIEAVEAKVDMVDDSINDLAASNTLENNNILAALTSIMGEMQDDQPIPEGPSINAPELNDAAQYTSARDFQTVNDDNGNKDDTTIKDTLVNDQGELYKETPLKLEFNNTINGQESLFAGTGNQKRQPLAGSYNLPTVQGSGITAAVADIDASMQLRLSQASPVVMPLITGYLLFLIGRWTFDTSNHLIAS